MAWNTFQQAFAQAVIDVDGYYPAAGYCGQAGACLASSLVDSLPYFMTPRRWARRAMALSWVTSTMVRCLSRQRPSSRAMMSFPHARRHAAHCYRPPVRSTLASAAAGRSRPARQPPNAPETRPPASASTTAAATAPMVTVAVSGTCTVGWPLTPVAGTRRTLPRRTRHRRRRSHQGAEEPRAAGRGAAGGLQQGDQASTDELLRLMGMIQGEASCMSRLVEDLLLLARYDAGRPLDRAPIDLASIAAEAAQHSRAAHPGRTVTLHAAEPAVVMADAERIRQVIDNLIGNAIQHTESPVAITVTTVPGGVQLTVADQGPGMTAEQASHVFERFYRTDGARTRARGGTGLGLAIAASLTAAHGGEISVDTQPGHGAAFHLRLPAAGSHHEQPATSAATPR